MKPVCLPPHHYAAAWKEEPRPVDETNVLAIEYAKLPDGPEKEARFLEIAEAFHGYLMKYVDMVHNGKLPMWGNHVNKDAKLLLDYFLPKDAPRCRQTYINACRTLHLAFKSMDVEEIYAVLSGILMRVVRKYDPFYTKKLRQVSEVISTNLARRTQISAIEVNENLDFDSDSFLRKLAKSGFLIPVIRDKKIVAYRRAPGKWPPPAALFKSGPIGFTYYLAKYFRYYLQGFIDSRMGEIESKAGVLQLDYRGIRSTGSRNRGESWSQCIPRSHDPLDTVVSTSGEFVNPYGRRFDADIALSNRNLDVEQLSLDWVKSTGNPLFADLRRGDRLLLFLIFARELDWKEVADTFGTDVKTIRSHYDRLMAGLRRRAGTDSKAGKDEREVQA